MLKRTLCMILIVLMMISTAACGGATPAETAAPAATTAAPAATTETTTAEATTAEATTAEATTAEAPEVKPVLELYTLDIMTNNDRPQSSDMTKVGKYIKDKFGIVVNYIPYSGDRQELQMVMLSSGDFADVQSMEYERVNQAYIDAGVLVDLAPYLDSMPDFKRVFQTAIPYWTQSGHGKLVKWDVGVPMKGEADIEVQDMLVRTDILEFYKWPVLVSEDDWVKFLKQAMIDFPKTDGMPTLGVASPFAESWGLSAIANIMYEKGDKFVELSNADLGILFDMKQEKFVDGFLEPSVQDSFKMLNRFYREGILDVESLTDLGTNVDEKCMNGGAIAVYYMCWGANAYNENLVKNGHPERQYITMPIQTNAQVAGGEKRAIRTEDTRSFNGWGITTKCPYPERVAELINWACSDEGAIIYRSGFEGAEWEKNASGERVFTTDRAATLRDAEVNKVLGTDSFEFLPYFNVLLSDGQFPNLLSHSKYYDQYVLTDRQKEAYAALGFKNSKSWWVDNGFFAGTGLANVIAMDPNTELFDTSTKMLELRVKTTGALILAKTEAEYNKLFDEAKVQYEKLNHQAVVDEMNRLYQEKKIK
jgi:putative aldouronate transport system substrate-binding protein